MSSICYELAPDARPGILLVLIGEEFSKRDALPADFSGTVTSPQRGLRARRAGSELVSAMEYMSYRII